MDYSKNEHYYQGVNTEMLKFIPSRAITVLEVGCGEGNLARILISGKREVWGVEYNPEAAKKAIPALFKVFVGAIEDKMDELPDNYFHLIIFGDVLEHLIDPSGVLIKIRSKLSEKGQILASIPNLRFATVLYNLVFKKDFTYTEIGILDNTHLRFFTKKTMMNLFENSGYVVNSISGIYKYRLPYRNAFMIFLSILTFSNCSDVLFPQFVILADKKKN
jgi:2-polyprenyl-3-methyl-5-hydroxy-6-metoxy-1,4-benzoquinol methylase